METQERPPRVNFSVSMTEDTRDALQARAREEGHDSRSQVIERYCQEGLKRDASE
jgi:metal-responsive CopG/Arc/MetJ family transcriptional regulator